MFTPADSLQCHYSIVLVEVQEFTSITFPTLHFNCYMSSTNDLAGLIVGFALLHGELLVE